MVFVTIYICTINLLLLFYNTTRMTHLKTVKKNIFLYKIFVDKGFILSLLFSIRYELKLLENDPGGPKHVAAQI